MKSAPTPTIADLLDLAVLLRRDEELPRQVLRERDQAIASDMASGHAGGTRRLFAWLNAMRDTANPPLPGEHAQSASRLVRLVLALVGGITGMAAAAAVLRYDGTHPVNVLYALALFVGLQLLVLVAFAAVVLPRKRFEAMPLVAMAVRILPGRSRRAIEQIVGGTQSHLLVFGQVQKWLLLQWTQVFAVAFNVGGLATTLALITFRDLAFVWSTTLQPDVATVHQVTSVLSWPWAAIWPEASPSVELIAATRYNRLTPGTLDPDMAGGWWPFLVASMVFFGLLPRMCTLMISRCRLKAAIARTFATLPGVSALHDRLEAAQVRTQATEPEQGAAVATGTSNHAAPVAPSAPMTLINWANVPIADGDAPRVVGRKFGTEIGQVLHAGGSASPEQDQSTVRSIASGSAVAILVRGWEPPMLELLDFITDVRKVIGRGATIALLPLALDGHAVNAAAWRSAVGRSGDPWLMVIDPAAIQEAGT